MPRPRQPRAGHRSSALCAILLLPMLSTGCGRDPPVVSGDLSCERFRHISADDAQRAVVAQNWTVLESWARQIASHNEEYDKDCTDKVGTPVSDPRGKSK